MNSCTEHAASLDGALPWALLDAMAESVILIDGHGVIRMMNSCAERLFGCSAPEMIGQSATRLIPHVDVSQAEHGLQFHAQPKEQAINGRRVEVEGVREDGTTFPMRLSLAAFRDGSEEVWVGVAHDLTEQRHIGGQPHAVAAVFEQSAEAMVITDHDGRIEAVNAAFKELTGYAEDEVLGRKYLDFLHSGRHGASYYAGICQSLIGTGVWRGKLWNRRKDGRIHPVWLSISSIKSSRNELTNFLAIYADAEPLEHQHDHLEYLAHHDPVTNLPNRLLLRGRFDHAVQRHSRHPGSLALLLVNLHCLAQINDTFGHAAGDRLLMEVAKRFTGAVRQEDTVARCGGDEFILMLEQLSAPKDAACVARKVLATLATPFRIDGHELDIRASIGISLYPLDGESLEELFLNADGALRRANQESENAPPAFAFASDQRTHAWVRGAQEPGASDRPLEGPDDRVAPAPMVMTEVNEESDGVSAGVIDAHKRTLALVDELLSPSRTRNVSELSEILRELYKGLTLHFAEEERRGGFFDIVTANTSENRDKTLVLLDQHYRVLSELVALLRFAHTIPADTAETEGPIRLFQGAAQLAESIRKHERMENELIANLGSLK